MYQIEINNSGHIILELLCCTAMNITSPIHDVLPLEAPLPTCHDDDDIAS